MVSVVRLWWGRRRGGEPVGLVLRRVGPGVRGGRIGRERLGVGCVRRHRTGLVFRATRARERPASINARQNKLHRACLN